MTHLDQRLDDTETTVHHTVDQPIDHPVIHPADHTSTEPVAPATPTDRRTVLRRLALGGVGAAAGAVAFGQTAAAGDSAGTAVGGNALELGATATNTSATPTTLDYTGTADLTTTSALSVALDAPNATDGNNVFPGAIGGYGKGAIANGVHGSTVSTAGAGVVAANLAPAQDADDTTPDAAAAGLIVASVGGPQIKFLELPGAVVGPTTGTHSPGELYVDADGTLWFTVPLPAAPPASTTDEALVVGDVRFVKLAGTPTAGQFHALPVAQRIFDSRTRTPATKLASRATVALDLTKTADNKDSGMPAGATAAVVNITLDQTERAGFARIVATGTDLAGVATSNINWYENNQIGANQATVALSAAGGATLEIGGTAGGTTHIIVDLQGYYL